MAFEKHEASITGGEGSAATTDTSEPSRAAAGDATVTASDLEAAMTKLRETGPLVQCITNIVGANWTANVLLAAGAAPAMIDNRHEAAGFAQVASGVLINLGTPYEDTTKAMFEAARSAHENGTAWVLDPVGAGGLPWRTRSGGDLLTTYGPTIVRGNASEILGLAGGAGGRGVDSTASSDDAVSVAQNLADEFGSVVAVSGEVDVFAASSGDVGGAAQLVRLANGDPLLTRVTGVGCSLGALMAAYTAVANPLLAAVAASAHLTIAAEDAAAASSGPGSFAVALLDALAGLVPQQVADRARLV